MRNVLAATAIAFVLTAPAAHANLLTNGSFETGDLTGWTIGGNFQNTQVVSGPFGAFPGAADGQFYLVSGAIGSPVTLTQTFKNPPNWPYHVKFRLFAVGDNPSNFTFTLGGGSHIYVNKTTNGVWFTQNAGGGGLSGLDTVTLTIRDDVGYIAIDGIEIEAVPEPGSLVLLLGGIAGLVTAGFGRRRARPPIG